MPQALQKISGLIFLFLLGSCSRESYFQKEALYKGGTPANLSQPKSGHVWATAGKHYQRSTIHTLFWGKHYRDVWAAPVQVPVLKLEDKHGGLVPAAMGGGLQSTSLALLNPDGRTYTLRTLDKDPSKSLSPFLQKTFVRNLMRDQTSAINPYAAFTIPPLAGAANIFHTNPKIYYVSQSGTGLGKYQESFGGKLVMLEEKFENKKALTPAFGNASDLITTEILLERKKSAHNQEVDQLAFARARLFDVLISDFDRHEGQWNWVEYSSHPDGMIYKPVPKDRDYAYYQYADGLIPWLLTRRMLVGKIKPFIHNIPDVGGIIYKARDLDNQFLNQVSAAEWEQVARELQTALKPAVIKQAIAEFPDSVYQLVGEQTEQRLNKRVEQLPQMAAEFYKILAKTVTITGSDKKEQFRIQHGLDKSTLVEVFTQPENNQEKTSRIYHRVFYYPETKKIILNGLGGADEFAADGQPKKGPKIVINGGGGEDKIVEWRGQRQ